MIIQRSFRYRLYPTHEQIAMLVQWENGLRFLWNLAHGQRVAMGQRCKVDRRVIGAFDQIRELTDLRADLSWLDDVPRSFCNQVLVALDLAWQKWFRGIAGQPKFKSKDRDRAPMICPQGSEFYVVGSGHESAVKLPKLGEVPAVVHRPLLGKQKTCAIVRDGDQWFAAITCEIEISDPAPSLKPPVAIDRGVVMLLADSDGRFTENPRHGAAMQPRIRRLQRTAARREKGSKNKKKTHAKIARLARKVKRQREYTLHVASKYYAKNHGVVILEKLNIVNMTASAKGTVDAPGTNVAAKSALNSAILDACWGKFATMLKYKVEPEGGRVLEVPAPYSSQECAECHHIDAASRVSRDRFVCTACRHADHADTNAARVQLGRGLKILAAETAVTVCGGTAARERPVKQKLCVARRKPRSAAP